MDRTESAPRIVYRHSPVTRVCHWINAICFFMLLMSGMQIFNAHPTLNFGRTTDFQHPFFSLEPNGFPYWTTLPQIEDLATGRRWHFFFAWLLVLNGAVYLGELFVAPAHPRLLRQRSRYQGHPARDHRSRAAALSQGRRGAALQRAAEARLSRRDRRLSGADPRRADDVAGDGRRLPWLLDLFGGRQSARPMHFLLASFLVAFFIVHLAMVVLSGPINNIASMITGRYGSRRTTMPPKTRHRLTRRETLLRLIAGGGALSLSGCDFDARDPGVLGIARFGRKADPLRPARAARAARGAGAANSASDISTYFRPNGSIAPDDPDYQDAVANNFADWKLEVGGLVENPLKLSLADLRALPRAPRSPATIASKAGAASANGPARR